MYIYIQFVVLLFNILYAYKKTGSVLAPSFMLNGGMCVASFLAILFYKDWDMQDMLFDTFIIITGGCSLFTIVSTNIINKKRCRLLTNFEDDIYSFKQLFRTDNLQHFLIVCVILQTLVAILKIHYYRLSFGGSLELSELLFASRMNFFDEDSIQVFPFWFRNIMQLFTSLSLFLYLLFIYSILTNTSLRLKILIWANIILQMVSSIFDGARGGVASSIALLAFVSLHKYFIFKGSRKLNFKYFLRLLIVAACIMSLLKISWEFVGRGENDNTILYEMAYYCGGEIKNLDLYMHKPYFSDGLTASTFHSLYSDFEKYFGTIPPKEVELVHNEYNGHVLGNVYTTFYDFYADGGFITVILYSLLMSIISSYIYNKANENQFLYLKAYEVVMVHILFSLFMCFFANRFYTEIITLKFLKSLLYWYLINLFFKRYIYKKGLL